MDRSIDDIKYIDNIIWNIIENIDRYYYDYTRRVCIHRNNTLNSQLSYWNGQKKWLLTSPKGETYPSFRKFTLHVFNPFSVFADWFRKRDGYRMKWTNRPRTKWGWGLKTDRLNSPPRKFWLQSIKMRFIKDVNRVIDLGTSIADRQFKFYKAQSLLKLRKNQNEIESNY